MIDDTEWPGKIIYNPEKGIITWRREIMAKEMKAKKEMKKPPMAKHMDAKEDKKMVKKMVKKSCVK